MLIGLGVILDRALAGGETDANRPGVVASRVVATLDPGRRLCQRPLDLDRRAPRLGVALDNGGLPGPALDITVTDLADGRVLDREPIAAGWALAPGAYYGFQLRRPLPGNRTVAVCARNVGDRPVGLVGKASITDSAIYAGTRSLRRDWAVYFPLAPDERRSYVRMLPDIFRRAAVLRPGVVSAATYAVLAILLLVGGPLLLWRAVTRASEEPEA